MRQTVLGIIRRILEASIRIALIKIALRKANFERRELEMKVRVTTHNGRSGKHGAYNPKHNDRQFDVSKSDHIDAMRMLENVNWDFQRGYRFPKKDANDGISFEEIELAYYRENFGEYVQNQNARNEKQRHPERNRTIEDMYKDEKTCPEETIWQIGNMEESVSPEVLLEIVEELLKRRDELYGSNVVTLDFALHNDESTPHIHERHVFQCRNRYGELIPQQENALKELGIELPQPKKASGQFNNRKMTFDATCRQMFLEICKEHGLEVEEVPIYSGKKSLEKNDYIIEKQQLQMMNQSVQIGKNEGLISHSKQELEDVTEKLSEKKSELGSTSLELEAKKSELVEVKDEIKVATVELGEKKSAVTKTKKQLKDTEDKLADTSTQLADREEEISQKDRQIQHKKNLIAQYDDEIEEKESRLEFVEEKTSEAEVFVADVCEIAFDMVYDNVAEKVASQTRYEYERKVSDGYMELLDAGFPVQIRQTVSQIMRKVIEAFDEPIRNIVDNLKYAFRRDFTESHLRENLEDKVWEHIENKAEYDRQKGEEESLMNQFLQARCRRRGR